MSSLQSFVELLKGKDMLSLPFVKNSPLSFDLPLCIWFFRSVHNDTYIHMLKIQYVPTFAVIIVIDTLE
jgi:hypothetical protein